MSAKKAPVRKLAAKKTSRSTQKSAPKKVAKTRPVKKPAKVAKKAAKKAAPARKTPKKTAKKAPTEKLSVKKATKKSAAKKATKKSVKKVTKKVATKVTKKAPAKKAPQKTAKKAAIPSPTPKIAAPSPAPPIPVAKKKVPAKPKPAGKQEAPIETKPPSAPNAEIPATPAKTITTSEPSHQALAPKEPIPKKEQKSKKPKPPAKRKTVETSAPPFSKEVKEALAVTPSIPLEEMPVLVCVQDPHPAPGILTLVEDSDVPAASGIPTQQWRLHAVLEQNPPRFFEGWATTGTFTLDVRVNASVKEKSGNWGGHTTISSGAKPCRITVSIGEDKQVKFSATEGVQHATGKHMPTEARYLIGDIAFTTKEGGVVEVAATSVICTEKWSHLIAHTAAATKGLAFDTRWGANLKVNDGFTVAAGVWTFAVMTRGEYEDLRQKKNWPAREIEP